MKRKCTVVFGHDNVGPFAMLRRRGKSINVINYPRGHRLTAAEKRRARKLLMESCL